MSFASNKYKEWDKYRKVHNEQKTRYRNKTGAFKYVRKRWTAEELELIKKHEIPDRELSELICRSVSAIQTQRSKLKW